MKALKPYNIAFVGLSNGEHEFSFELDNDFFVCFDGHELGSSQLKGKLILNKKPNMLDLEIFIFGTITLECDRCLEPFDYPIDVQKALYIKFGDKNEEQSDDVIIIPSTDSHIDVSQYFFEFAVLSIPLRKVHDDFPEGNQGCDPLILKQLEKYMPKGQKSSKEKGNDKPSDSRWDALRNLKFN